MTVPVVIGVPFPILQSGLDFVSGRDTCLFVDFWGRISEKMVWLARGMLIDSSEDSFIG